MKNTTVKIYSTLIAISFLSALAVEAEEKSATNGAKAVQSQTVDIKPRWQVGKKFTLTSTTEEASTITIGNQKMDQKSGLTMGYTLAIRAHENGKFKRVTLNFDRIAMELIMAGEEAKFDSAKPGDDPRGLGKSFGTLIGKELKIVLDEKDDVIEVGNLDAILKQMDADNPGDSTFAQFFSKDAIKKMIRQSSLHGAPGKPVKASDAWSFTYSESMEPIGKFSIDGNYTMNGQSECGGAKCVELEIAGKIEIDAEPAEPATEGTLSGSAWFDPALGICRESETTQQMNLQMMNPLKPGEMTQIPMKQVVKQTITKVEDL